MEKMGLSNGRAFDFRRLFCYDKEKKQVEHGASLDF